MNNLRSLEQDRAKFAYNVVSDVKGKSKEIQKKFSSYVKNSPVLILSNGLSQTLAFYLSKMKIKSDVEYKSVKSELEKPDGFENKSERIAYGYLYYYISKWLAEESNCGRGLTNGKDPLKFVMEDADVTKVMQVTQETIMLLNWMRRFADAMLEKEE